MPRGPWRPIYSARVNIELGPRVDDRNEVVSGESASHCPKRQLSHQSGEERHLGKMSELNFYSVSSPHPTLQVPVRVSA